MSNDLILLGVAAWLLAALLALAGRARALARALLGFGGLAVLGSVLATLPAGSPPVLTPLGIGATGSRFALAPEALWLLGFGLPGAVLAAWLGPPGKGQRAWVFGAAASLLGALGVFGLNDAASFLVAWEIMSLGGAVMILGEDLTSEKGRPVLFMLSLLEAGSVALLLAFVILASHANSWSFGDFAKAARAMPQAERLFVAFLLLAGFGAKLGLLPFYEWFPGAYGAASGATGAFFSGIVLNAAFFGLARGLIAWLPAGSGVSVSLCGVFVLAIAVLSAILTALYAFQQDAWRELLSLSSAENGSIAVALLGAALMFRHDGLADLAGLAWTVALLQLAGHALAKGAMFLSADGVFRAAGDYRLAQRGILGRSPFVFGFGALLAAMSLAAMPPQAGFVSEWYLFETIFQGFRLATLGSRLAAALAGAGLALTAAVSLAVFVKLFGIGLLGRREQPGRGVGLANSLAVGVLGLLVLALAVGMPVWLGALGQAVSDRFGVDAAAKMAHGWLLVPLTAKFAFISPSKLAIAMPLLSLAPIGLLFLSRRAAMRRSPVWDGGRQEDGRRAATTALAFSNALRTFYSFIYRPTLDTARESAHAANGQPYFIKRLVFTHDVAPVFGPFLFLPLEKLVLALAAKLRIVQSGHLNVYLSLLGVLVVGILIVALT